MKRVAVLLTSAALLILASGGSSRAQILTTTDTRCAGSGISTNVAHARYAWAAFCKAHPATGRGPSLYLSDASVNAYDAALPALKQRLYPVYYNAVSEGLWNVPSTAYTITSSGQASHCNALPNGASHLGLCVAGCFPPDAHVTFSSGDIPIKEAHDSGRSDLVTLGPDATLDAPDYITNQVASYTLDLVDSWQTIVSFTMASGGRLRVTDEHPLVIASGEVRRARTLEPGVLLVRADGTPDSILRVDIERYFGKVYHVKPATLDHATNIIVAQGYLNGSSRYQNEFLDLTNRVILRRALEDLPLDLDEEDTAIHTSQP